MCSTFLGNSKPLCSRTTFENLPLKYLRSGLIKLLSSRLIESSSLKSPKYRGFNKFYDYYAQFPEKQDDQGYVTWEYAHHREHGAIIDPELLKQVDELVETIEWKPRQNEFYLAGVVLAPNGTRYYGEAAKSGKNYYYYNRKAGHRIIAGELHDIVTKKLKGLIEDSRKFESLLENAKLQKHFGLGQFAEEKAYLMARLEELKQIEARFSDSIRSLALKGADDLENAISLLVDEKDAAKKEIEEINCSLIGLEQREKSYKNSFQGDALQKFLKMIFRDFDKMYDIEKKTLLQAVFPQILVHVGQEGVDLEVVTSLDPFQSPTPASGNGGRGEGSAKILPFPSIKNSNQNLDIKKSHLGLPSPVRGEEDTYTAPTLDIE